MERQKILFYDSKKDNTKRNIELDYVIISIYVF